MHTNLIGSLESLRLSRTLRGNECQLNCMSQLKPPITSAGVPEYEKSVELIISITGTGTMVRFCRILSSRGSNQFTFASQ